jgi:hypothetical protein
VTTPKQGEFPMTPKRGQYLHIVIDHRQRLLLLRQISPGHRAIGDPVSRGR